MELLLFWLFLLFLLLRVPCSGQSTVRSGTLHNVFDVPVAPVPPTSSTSSSSSTARDGSSSPLSLVSALIVVFISQGFRQSSLMTDRLKSSSAAHSVLIGGVMFNVHNGDVLSTERIQIPGDPGSVSHRPELFD